MGLEPEAELKAGAFAGMVSNKNARALRPGEAQLQVNVTAVRHGELTVRRGLRELQFDSDDQ